MAKKNNDGSEPVFAGIDFGACNIKGVKLAGKHLRVLKLNKEDMGGNEIANFLYYKQLKNGGTENLLGNKARNHCQNDAANGVWDLKRHIEQEDWQKTIPNLNRAISAVEAATDIFSCVKKALLKGEDKPLHAVLTVPVSYTGIQRTRLAEAAKQAGIQVQGFITESFAAMFALTDLQADDLKLTVIFDFGGSTLDVSVIAVSNAAGKLSIQEVVTGGIPLGGATIDQAIFDDVVLARFKDELVAHWPGDMDVVRQHLLLEIEKNKKQMYLDQEDSVDIAINPDIILKNSDMEEIVSGDSCRGRIVRLLDSLFDRLEDNFCGYTKLDVTKVIALGGTMRIPYFAHLLEEYFGKAVFASGDYDFDDVSDFVDGLESRYEIVAAGAAKYLQLLSNEREMVDISSVSPFEFGYMQGNNFECCIASNLPPSYESTYHVLHRADLEATNWHLGLFQVYSDADILEPVYMGEIVLNHELYADTEPPLLKMRIERNGDLRLRIYQKYQNSEASEDDDLDLVEEHFLKPGRI